ncbi:MAG: hypothetical protein ACI837_002744 [Crocinitomicaceae bacterium]|jgi:hypothetical protein
MRLSKIGSANTYTRCLKQLDEWGYIQYLPSYNPLKGSIVNLYSFDNSSDKGADKGSGKSSSYGSEIVVRPSTNNLNNKKPYKPRKEKMSFSPPLIEDVKVFFLEIKSTSDQAEQFHNHFESNGWLVGGKAKMKDWYAAARNWVKRSAKFNNTSNDRLHAEQNKDYSVPL